MSSEGVHGDRLGKMALHVVDELGGHADVRGGSGLLVMACGFILAGYQLAGYAI